MTFAGATAAACVSSLSGSSASAAPVSKQSDSPNVLFIIADDLRPELGCYGQAHIISPNIDAIAADGMRFTHSYVQDAVSAASRASFLTGCRPVTTGVQYPYSEYFVNEFLPSHATVQRHFFNNGYYVRTLGKVHHGLAENFTEKHFGEGGKSYALPQNQALAKDKVNRLPFEFADVPEEEYADGGMARETIATIGRAKASGKPFFIAAGFLKPHLPWVAPKKYWDMYEGRQLPECPWPEPTVGEMPWSRSHVNLVTYKGETDAGGHVVSTPYAQQLRRAYFSCVTFVDTQVGLIIAELKKQGLYDNTVILLIGDHGWHLGDNGMWGKQTNFERATFSPLIVKGVKAEHGKGKVCDRFVEYVDIYPTFCQLAGLEVPGFLEGASFAPLLSNNTQSWKRAAFSEFPRGGNAYGYTVRTDRYRYTEWRKSRFSTEVVGRELYDHSTDPLESHNIAAKNSKKCAELSVILNQGWRGSLPSGVVNASNNKVAPPAVGWGPEAAAKKDQQKGGNNNKKAKPKNTALDSMQSLIDEEIALNTNN